MYFRAGSEILVRITNNPGSCVGWQKHTTAARQHERQQSHPPVSDTRRGRPFLRWSSLSKLVDVLKEQIKEEAANTLSGRRRQGPPTLESGLCAFPRKANTSDFRDIGKERRAVLDKGPGFFPEPPAEEHIHVVVCRPPGVCCFFSVVVAGRQFLTGIELCSSSVGSIATVAANWWEHLTKRPHENTPLRLSDFSFSIVVIRTSNDRSRIRWARELKGGKRHLFFCSVDTANVDVPVSFYPQFDGINPATPYLPREGLLQRLYDIFRNCDINSQFVVMSSPAASGKTSLLTLFRIRYPQFHFLFMNLRDTLMSAEDLLSMNGINLTWKQLHPQLPRDKEIIVMLDDAQTKYRGNVILGEAY